MLIINNKSLKVGNKWLNPVESPTPTPPGPTFDEVTIGTQTWMASNLAIDDGGEGIVHFDNVTANGVNFGTQYFYTWEAANRIANNIVGWHLPSMSELQTLEAAIGGEECGNKLKSTTGWSNNGNGTDDYGFGVYPVGYMYSGDPDLYLTGEAVHYWLSDLNNSSSARQFYFETSIYVWLDVGDITNKYCVRLIKDT